MPILFSLCSNEETKLKNDRAAVLPKVHRSVQISFSCTTVYCLVSCIHVQIKHVRNGILVKNKSKILILVALLQTEFSS